ncbi:hypothetical protein AVEN_104174-1 [Araneus ventricosus]|uniref:Paired domain-containing protein n=1 Tax=Araneus ventricosus TaxID=182803 RepID=A0A4Y2LND7_ARAVE|nr:hypothetical protein AVEN_104174-1 [Araneus ventricosus]
MAERIVHGLRKNVPEWKKGRIIGLLQRQKSYKEIAEISSICLCTVQRIIKSWKDVNEPSSSRKIGCRNTILYNRDRRSLKRLLKSNSQILTLELTNSFDKGSKTTSTYNETIMNGFKSSDAARKSLVTETNR